MERAGRERGGGRENANDLQDPSWGSKTSRFFGGMKMKEERMESLGLKTGIPPHTLFASPSFRLLQDLVLPQFIHLDDPPCTLSCPAPAPSLPPSASATSLTPLHLLSPTRPALPP
eukprot:768633-Hanusia_phi.AAC.11